MSNHVGSQVGALSYPVSPKRGDSPLYGSGTFASRLERMHARGDTCKHLYQPVPLTGEARRSSILFCVCLGHRVMQNQVGSQVGAQSYPVSPEQGDSPLYGSRTFASRLERMHARGDTCKHLYQPLTTLTHIC